MRTTTIGLAFLALVASVPAVAQAAVAPADYQQPRVFKLVDPDGDVTSGDIIENRLQVDPTLGQVSVFGFVLGQTASVIVFGLGTTDAMGACQPVWEVVGASDHDSSWIVRAPGDTSLPPAVSATPYVAVDPRLVGFVPTCAVEHTSTTAGAPLDSATDLSADLVPVTNRDLTLFAEPKVMQETPAHGFDLRFAFPEVPSPDGFTQSPLYGFDIELTPGPGVTLDRTQVLETAGSRDYQPQVVPHATAAGPGATYVDVSVTAGNGEPWQARLYLWAVGGPHPRATQSLAGFGVYSHYLAVNQHGDFQPHNAHLWFLDSRFATTANGGIGGLPRCTQVTTKCQRYWYNARSGVLQVGEWRGFVTPDFVRWQAGYTSDLEQVETDFGPQFDGTYPQRLLAHWSGHRLRVGTYRYYRKPPPPDGSGGTKIRILVGRRYTISSTATHHVDERGSYRIAAGHITFEPDGGYASPVRFAIAAKGLHWLAAPRAGFLVADRFFARVTAGS
jgi:hypothetical protein